MLLINTKKRLSTLQILELRVIFQIFLFDCVVQGVSVDLPAMMQSKEKAVEGLTSGIESLFKKNKVNYAKGKGSPNLVKVTKFDGTIETIPTKNIVIATGSDVMSVPGLQVI
jgi:dihydrolipoamide dehydrogenase